LAKSAIDAVSQWKYKPYLLNGQPVDVQTTINVNYTLDGDSKPNDAQPDPNPGPSASAAPGPNASPKPEPVKDSAGNRVRHIGGGVTAPMLIYKVNPEYTPEAKATKIHGPVLVNLIVNEKGEPENVRVVRGIGYGLDQNAVVTVSHYRFKPATEDGKAVPVSVNVEVNYQVF
jgi:protein TonB